MTTAPCISCNAVSPDPDDVPHETWCPLFMRPVDYPQLDLFAEPTND